MPQRPTGTVTFLFTDVEGSTRLLKELRGRYGGLLAEHQRPRDRPPSLWLTCID